LPAQTQYHDCFDTANTCIYPEDHTVSIKLAPSIQSF
jgi:hypothetical protein